MDMAWYECLLQPLSQSVINPLSLCERIKTLDKPITLTFLSDCILLDPWGRLISDPTSEELARILGLPELDIINTFISVREIEGFHGAAGLPKFRDLAVTAGSTIGVWVNGRDLSKTLEVLSGLETDGLGLRRNEGFGRVAFNHVVYDQMLLDKTVELTQISMPESWEAELGYMELWEKVAKEVRFFEPSSTRALGKKEAVRGRELARWLYAQAHLPVEELMAKVAKLGQLEVLEQFNIAPSKATNMYKTLGGSLCRDLQRLFEISEDS